MALNVCVYIKYVSEKWREKWSSTFCRTCSNVVSV